MPGGVVFKGVGGTVGEVDRQINSSEARGDWIRSQDGGGRKVGESERLEEVQEIEAMARDGPERASAALLRLE